MANVSILTKNAVVDLDIVDFGINGEGIGRIENLVVFVENAVPGDNVRVRLFKLKKNYALGAIEQIFTPSPSRQKPECPVFQSCGGCSMQHVAYAAELAFKQKKVNDALERIGKISFSINQIEAAAQLYPHRNKALYHVQLKHGEIVMGFYSPRSKEIIPVNCCKVCPKVNSSILNAVAEYMEESHVLPYDYQSRGGTVKSVMVRQSYATGEILVCIIATTRSLPNAAGLIYRLTECVKNHTIGNRPAILKGISLNVSNSPTRETLGEETRFIYGDQFITERIGDLSYQISPASFFQVNSLMAKVLYDTVSEFCALQGNEFVIDAYCGTGSISLYLAKKVQKIIGIELSPQAIADANTNAELNQIGNAHFICGDSATELGILHDANAKPDIIILDPPRSGCSEAVLCQLQQLCPQRIVYVSCDPATLARDLQVMCSFGYHAANGRCVDMFCRSGHVECVVLMTRI